MKKLLLCLLAALLLLPGCGSKEEEDYPKTSEPAVIIVGHHANSNVPPEDITEQLTNLVENSVRREIVNGSFVWSFDLNIISCDGNPEVMSLNDLLLQTNDDDLPAEDILGDDMDASTERSEAYDFSMRLLKDTQPLITRALTTTITNAAQDPLAANDEEVNLVKAVNLAVNALNRMDGAKKHLLILDPGINTVGAMSLLRYDIETMSAEEILNDMSQDAFIQVPKNEDGEPSIDVVMDYIGNVGGAQVPVPDTKTESLKALWTGYFEKCGFEIASVNPLMTAGEAFLYSESSDSSSYPYVSAVPFTTNEDSNYYCFRAAEIGFKADSAQLRSRENAERAIDKQSEAIIKELKRDPGSKLYVVGSVAKLSPDEDHRTDPLAAERAQVVADMLADLGVDPNRMVIIDAGSHELDWRNEPEFPNGADSPDQKAMENNRVVAVFSSKDDEHVQELKDEGYIKG